ncbi:MAG TPA: CBS domain-containing protein [Candidatus Baltobacteraceae bacterium]|nr:CBS domain-containing protein [Candidatus Baltobacteraceae bacterium]
MPRQTINEFLNGRTLVSLPPQTNVRVAAEIMAQHAIGAVPVLEGERLVGMFSERDVLTRVVATGLNPVGTTLQQVMTQAPKTISADETLHDAFEVMHEGGFRHLPVVREGGVIGMLSLRDIPMDVMARRHNFQALRAWRPGELHTETEVGNSARAGQAPEPEHKLPNRLTI